MPEWTIVSDEQLPDDHTGPCGRRITARLGDIEETVEVVPQASDLEIEGMIGYAFATSRQ